ncbi:golgin subfamily A member 1 isoform X1 [Tachysurus vachellii]|uniref:golgin subfamily A member 1 isoform X1 n=1 Tax=Tachysurus vachellii TaxID=175792 RepID=UPI00296AE902|nr:golgin subfamily A member 1 isoform X1 [Tachysurus vachellii]XP_060737075.1 golgin subfamily A member 1 isoform X1 [Tachysurus vachellii]
MFAKLKKKIAEEAATATPRPGRLPRSYSKESITSVGADSGDDFASDGSSSRDDLSSQILRRNDQIRKLEAKLSDYAEQLRLMQKTKDKLEIALEKHQDSSMRKLQDQNENFQANRAKMAEGMALALEKKDQEWMDKMAALEKEKSLLEARLDQSLSLFQKRDEQDELEGFQMQELAKVKHMLLRKEEQLSQKERELKLRGDELNTARITLAHTQDKLYELGEEHEETRSINTQLRAHRDKLLSEKDEAERRISDLTAREEELQQLVRQVSEDFQKAQSDARSLQKSMESLQSEHDELKLRHVQHKGKAAVTEEEREHLLANLQEKVLSLERRLEANLSQDEHLQELLKEKLLLEQRLEEARRELLEERTNHMTTVSSLEAQISKLNTNMSELQTLLRHKDDSSRSYRERTEAQIADLEQRLNNSTTRLRSLEGQLEEKETHRVKLQAEWVEERERLQQQVSTQRQRGLEKTAKLEEEILVLQREREAEISSHQDNVRLLEEQKATLLKDRAEMENTVQKLSLELENSRAELSSRQTVSVEIAKALEETRKQREELQQQVSDMSESVRRAEQEACRLSEQVGVKEVELSRLREELQAALSGLSSLQVECEALRTEADEKDVQIELLRQEILTHTQHADTNQSKARDAQGDVESVTAQLQDEEVCVSEQNGSVTAGDVDELQKANKELEQQLSEKNKTIKQLQQRLTELKRTLQKELKLKPDADSESKEKLQEGKPSSEAPGPATSSTLAPGFSQGPGPATYSSKTKVTNSSDLTDTREINFEYLKHVVLKFMSSREAEAYQLIRAISVLLHFTREEEDMLKQTLEYKMSWFGSKPTPKGIIRPSISGTPSSWM